MIDWSADTLETRRAWLAALKRWTMQKGWKPGWAAWQYRRRWGDWPASDVRDVPAARVVAGHVRTWVTMTRAHERRPGGWAYVQPQTVYEPAQDLGAPQSGAACGEHVSAEGATPSRPAEADPLLVFGLTWRLTPRGLELAP